VADHDAAKDQLASADELRQWAAAWRRHQDHDAARRLMDALYPQVIAIIRARLPRRMAEEDLAQEIFVRFFERLGSWDGRAPLTHWVSRLAVNHCIDQLRFERRRPELRLADLTEDEAEAVTANLASTEPRADHAAGASELAAKLLATLSPEERTVIAMLDLEGYTSTEVEALTGWSGVAVRVRAFRARRKLRKLLYDLGEAR
jgi:RNA polymerase sigma-70 factor (ECF subfamily)